MSLKISKIFAIPLIFSSFLFDTKNKDEKIRGIAKILDIFKLLFDLFLIHIIKDNIFIFKLNLPREFI